MKKLVTATVLATAATSAMAFDYKINLEGRADAVYDKVKTTTSAGSVTNEKYMDFANNLIRLNMFGAINENLSYRFRYRFAKEAANPASTNTSSTTDAVKSREITTTTQVDYFFVDHKNSLFTLRLGKQNWGGAPYGREGIVAGTDVFLLSQAGANYKTAFGSDYRFGATAMFKFMDTNTLDLGVSNPNSTITDQTGAELKNTGVAFTAVYMGTFFNKALQPVLSYSIAKQNGDTDNPTTTARTKDGNNKMWNAGLRSEVAGLVIDADYKELKVDNRSGAGLTNSVGAKTKSIYANVAYTFGDFTPMATYINDKFDSETNTLDFKKNSFAVGTYYKPFSDVNFRYHAMFTSAVKKADGATSTVSKVDDKKVYLGFKIDL